jgi:hypothetical protein
MAGKKFFNNQNVYVETDYQNIVVVDPNKVVDPDGTVHERLVNHEELVMYANLEAKVLPRTKLAVGNNFDDTVQNLRIGVMDGEIDGTINFLKPKGQNYYDTSWTDQLTGDQSLEGKGINQTKSSWQEKQIRLSDGKTETNFVQRRDVMNQKDTGLLGITSISIKLNTSGVPSVTIEMVDVQGRVLFEQGENSPYSAFMQMPYPLFTLTIKGFFGKAIRYELMLKDFNARFDASDGNYKITTNYLARTYALLSDIQVNSLFALPRMYTTESTVTENNTKVPSTVLSTGTQNSLTPPVVIKSSRGYNKIKEVYSVYKSKGLIDENLPELTMNQLIMKLDNFEKYVMELYGKQDMSVLFDIRDYKKNLEEYRNSIYGVIKDSWFVKYVSSNKRYILNNQEKSLLNVLKPEFSKQEKRDALAELDGLMNKFNNLLNTNKTFGENGSCVIGKETITDCALSVKINRNFLTRKIREENDFDYAESYNVTNGRRPNPAELADFTAKEKLAFTTEKNSQIDASTGQLVEDPVVNLFLEYGTKLSKPPYNEKTFLGKLAKLEEQFNQKRQYIEDRLSEELSNKIKSNDIGLGFNPTVKNVVAIICANADAFMRLMDDVHKEAWEQRNNPVRLSAIVDSQKAFNMDNKEALESVTVDGKLKNSALVYPWPQYLELQKDEKGNEEYVAMYPGDSTVSPKIQGYDSSIWPEIKFVEEYLKAAVQTEGEVFNFDFPNEGNQISLLMPCSLEFPFVNTPYTNLTEVSYYYEIFERILMNVSYGKYVRTDLSSLTKIMPILAEMEFLNVKESSKKSPEITKKLKDVPFSYDSFIKYLNSISISGSWGLYERDEFVTPYIREILSQDFGLYDVDYAFSSSVDILNGGEEIKKMEEYLNSPETDKPTFLDTYPFTNFEWSKSNMNKGKKLNNIDDAFKTKNNFYILSTKKCVSTFEVNDDLLNKNKFFTNLNWININSESPNQVQNNLLEGGEQVININTYESARKYYNDRNHEKFYLTESYLNYGDQYDQTINNLTPTQSTSLLNTPFFVNAISKGIENKKAAIEDPYVGLGYLYLNSLPLSTTRESIYDPLSALAENDPYIFTVLNKYSAIHSQSYMWFLKVGSIWHRYKKYENLNIDILDDIWEDFDYVKNYDPLTENIEKEYQIKNISGNTFNFTHKLKINNTLVENTVPPTTIDAEYLSINIGIYPKVINDIYHYFTNKDVFVNYTEEEFDNAYNVRKLKIEKNNKGRIFKTTKHDPNNPNRILGVDSWFGYFELSGNTEFEEYGTNNLLIIPSFGDFKFNQIQYECFNETDGKLTLDIENNNAVYNGGVRSLWSAPNFGYFNTQKINKPRHDEYIKFVDPEKDNYQPFNLTNTGYSSIEEIFGLFTKEILDLFETHFLNFCKEPEKVNPNILNINQGDFETFLTNITTAEGVDRQNLSQEQLFKYRSLFENNGNFFKSNEKVIYYKVTLHDIMKKIFMVPDVPVTNTSEERASKIAELQSRNFLNYQIAQISTQAIFKFGNPGKFNRKVFNSFSNNLLRNPVDKLYFGKYVPLSVPTNENLVTLADSIANYPNQWKALKTYVGFSNIEQLRYKDNGSFITDFFREFNVEFSESNIINLSQLIKIFATKKLENPTYDAADFYNDLDSFLNSIDVVHEGVLNITMVSLNKKLPVVSTVESNAAFSHIDGNVAKIDAWETFRLINDKWISGQDFETRTIFEDFLFLDRANRPVGDKIVIDIEELRTYLKGRNKSLTIYQLVGHILEVNNFTFLPTPVYTNFYGRNDRVKEGQPVPQDIPNDLFGTFMEVDARESRPRMLAIYAGKPSENLDDRNYANSRRLDDAFDLTRASDCPLIENQIDKKDYSESNKCVGFNVDFGTRNQGIFHGMSLDMNQNKNIGPTFQVLADMGSQNSQQKVAQQSQSLYNFYKTKSYTCQITSMGNAMIQPTMYFNLRHVPMFTGPYFITNVEHTISPGNFDTNFTGVRMPKYALQAPDKLVMSVNKEILKTFENKLNAQQQEEKKKQQVNPANETLPQRENKSTDERKCQDTTKYPSKPFVNYVETTIPKNQIITILNTNTNVNSNIKRFIYGLALVENKTSGGNIKCVNNNIFNIKTNNTIYINNKERFFASQVCTENNVDGTIPMASFTSVEDSLNYVLDEIKPHEPTITELINKLGQDKTADAFTHLWAAIWYRSVNASTAQDIINNITAFKTSSAYIEAKNRFDYGIKNY